MSDTVDRLGEEIAEKAFDLLAPRLMGFLDRHMKSQAKVIFSEEEAATFLTCSVDTLQAWRKRGLIGYARYPLGKIRDGQEDGLGSIYTYDAAQLLAFRERYIKQLPGENRFEIHSVISLAGPEIRDKAMRKAA